MNIDFALLLKNKSLKIEREETVEGFEIYEDVVIPASFQLITRAYTEHDMIVIELSARYRTKMTCSRCLITFDKNEELHFKEKYTPKQLNEAYPQGIADTVQLAREQIILKTSTKNVCKDVCLGLCPVCGTDKNIHRCHCESNAKNPYFEKLEGLFSDTDKEV